MKPPRGKPRSIILWGFIIQIQIGIAIEIETIWHFGPKIWTFTPLDSSCCAAHKKANDLSEHPEIDSDTDSDTDFDTASMIWTQALVVKISIRSKLREIKP